MGHTKPTQQQQQQQQHVLVPSHPRQTPASDRHEVLLGAVRRGDSRELLRVLQGMEGAPINVNVFDREGQTALHRCCLHGQLELVKLLVQFGADVQLANRDGWSALHIAAHGGHSDIALYLIANAKRIPHRVVGVKC